MNSIDVISRLRATSKSADYTAVADDLVVMDASAAARAVSLPGSPATNDQVAVVAKSVTGGNVTINRNGKNINGAAANLTLSAANQFALLQYDGTEWWVLASGRSFDASLLTSGTIPTARLGSGTADATKYLRGDSSWQVPSLDAASIATGTIATARLGSGAASSSTFLRGDQAWATPLSYDLVSQLTNGETSITGATTATVGRMHVCSGTTADYTVTLPTAAGNTGKLMGFRMASGLTKFVTLDGNGTEKIDNALTKKMWAGESVTLLCDGSNWFTMPGGKSIPLVGCIRRNTNQTGITNALAANTVLLDTSVNDNSGLMVETANNRIRIKRAGVYDVKANISLDLNGTGAATRCIANLFLNGSQIARFEQSNCAASTTPSLPASLDGYYFAEDDLLTLVVAQNSSGNQQLLGSSTIFYTYLSVTEVTGGGGGGGSSDLVMQTAQTASFTAVAGRMYPVDMSAAGADFTVTAPASPSHGDKFGYFLARSSATYECLFGRNSSNVMGGTDADPYLLYIAGEVVVWQYDATSSGRGWFLANDGRLPGSITCTPSGTLNISSQTRLTLTADTSFGLSTASNAVVLRRKSQYQFGGQYTLNALAAQQAATLRVNLNSGGSYSGAGTIAFSEMTNGRTAATDTTIALAPKYREFNANDSLDLWGLATSGTPALYGLVFTCHFTISERLK